MKTIATAITTVAISLGLISCSTTYDAYGRPVQSVDPGTATVGIIGAGLLGAAIANNNKDKHRHHRHHRHHRSYYRGHR